MEQGAEGTRPGGDRQGETRLFKVGAESPLEELRVAFKEGQEEVVEVADRVTVALPDGARERTERQRFTESPTFEPSRFSH